MNSRCDSGSKASRTASADTGAPDGGTAAAAPGPPAAARPGWPHPRRPPAPRLPPRPRLRAAALRLPPARLPFSPPKTRPAPRPDGCGRRLCRGFGERRSTRRPPRAIPDRPPGGGAAARRRSVPGARRMALPRRTGSRAPRRPCPAAEQALQPAPHGGVRAPGAACVDTSRAARRRPGSARSPGSTPTGRPRRRVGRGSAAPINCSRRRRDV